jgi:hypothetical protein
VLGSASMTTSPLAISCVLQHDFGQFRYHAYMLIAVFGFWGRIQPRACLKELVNIVSLQCT